MKKEVFVGMDKFGVIKKKIDHFYLGKYIIVGGLIATLIGHVVIISAMVFLKSEVLARYWVAVYGMMGVFVVLAWRYPILTYNLKKYLEKGDITSVLKYMEEFTGSWNKYLDAMLIIKRTVKEMISDSKTMNRTTADEKEMVLNSAWDSLDSFFMVPNIWDINRAKAKAYAKELGNQVSDYKYDYLKLQEIQNTDYEEVAEKKHKNISVSQAVIHSICAVLLLLYLLVKFVVPSIVGADNMPSLLSAYSSGGGDVLFLVTEIVAVIYGRQKKK